MRVNTRFTVAVHTMALIALSEASAVTSEMMAESVGNHPVVIRQVMSALKKADLIETHNGLPGGKLKKSQKDITLYDIYNAVKSGEETALFDIHPNPNPNCPVGCNIKDALYAPLADAQSAMEQSLGNYTLYDITKFITDKYNNTECCRL